MDVVLLVNVTELLILGRHRKEESCNICLSKFMLLHLFQIQKSKYPFRLLRFVYKYLLSGKGKVKSQHMNVPLRNLNVNCNHLSVPHQLFLALGLSLVDKALNILL